MELNYNLLNSVATFMTHNVISQLQQCCATTFEPVCAEKYATRKLSVDVNEGVNSRINQINKLSETTMAQQLYTYIHA